MLYCVSYILHSFTNLEKQYTLFKRKENTDFISQSNFNKFVNPAINSLKKINYEESEGIKGIVDTFVILIRRINEQFRKQISRQPVSPQTVPNSVNNSTV